MEKFGNFTRPSAREARVIARGARQNALIRSLWWLELSDLDESWYVGGHRLC